MIVFPNCKINLGLFVTDKRADGFHNLESLFIPTPLSDILEVIPSTASTCELSVSGTSISGDPKSISVFKAWKLMHEKFGVGGVKAHLHKIIPTGAGLGGGSADGVFMLKAVRDLFLPELCNIELLPLAEQLGSDCPFFLENKPAFVTGRGEFIEPFELNLSSYFIVLVNPGIHVSTPEAYAMIHPQPAAFDLRKINTLNIHDWKNIIVNDFEAPMIQRFPEIGNIKQTLYDLGASYASMSGSGSTVFGIFDREVELQSSFSQHFYFSGKMV